MSRVMIAATGSGSGKTTIVCGLCQCIKDMGLMPLALKCGPELYRFNVSFKSIKHENRQP